MEYSFWRFDDTELNRIKEFLSKPPGRAINIELENKFAEKFGTKYAISMNSGTSALDACMYAIGLKPGDEVIVPPLTFISTSFCVMHHGAKPIFADIDPETFTIDPSDIERKITKMTKAVIPVSIYGLSANMDPIMELAQKHNLKVIEDNAQCVLGKYKGKLTGSIGDMTIYSFERTKHITCGDGGMITTNNPELAKKARKWGKLGYTTLTADPSGSKPSKELMQSPDFERHDSLGMNYRLPEVCATIMLSQLEKLDEFLNNRKKIGKSLEEAVDGCTWLRPQKTPGEYEHTYFTVAMALDTNKVSWQEFRKKFIEYGGDQFYAAWKLSYQEPILKEKYPQRGLCPVAEDLQPKLVQFKTNYKANERLEEQTNALRETIKKLDGK